MEVLLRFGRLVEQVLWRDAQDLNDFVHLVDLVGAGEERLAGVHLHQDAAERPNIDGQVVGDSQQNLRGPENDK